MEQLAEAVAAVAQGALRNTVRHARAGAVSLALRHEPDGLVEVQDNGAGFDPATDAPGHLGPHTMRERVTRLRGVLTVDSAPGAGTRIEVRIPL